MSDERKQIDERQPEAEPSKETSPQSGAQSPLKSTTVSYIVASKAWYPILTALGGLYMVAAISQVLLQPGLRSYLMLGLVGVTVATLVVFRWIFARGKLSARATESAGALLAGLVLITAVTHLYHLSGFRETINLVLLGIGIACFFLKPGRLTLVLVTTLGIWVIVAWSAGATPSWLHFAFGLFAAAGLRLHTEFRQSELKAAYAAAQREIAKREEAELALRESEERYALAAVGSNDGLWDWDLKKHEVFFSPRWKAMIGYEEGNGVGTHPREWLDRIHVEDRARVRSTLLKHIEGESPHFEAEYRILHKDGTHRWVLCRGVAVRDAAGAAYRLAGSQTDVTARHLAEEQLVHDALYDHLTGLPNRALFTDRLQEAMKRAKRYANYVFALLFLDLDRFKIVNDSLGHLAGDELLRIVAERLERAVRGVDTVARFGGDEFAVLLGDLRRPSDAVRVVERVQKSLQSPFSLQDHEVFTSASIGVVLGSTAYALPEEMLRDADTAMYRAKARAKGGFELFTPGMLHDAQSVLRLESDLRNAIQREEFCLHFQPIIALGTGKIAGFEALVRWNHPARGLLWPGEFLSVAEDADLLAPIGWQVLRDACRQLCLWQKRLPQDPPLSMSVNVSPKQFARADFVERVESIVQSTGLQHGTLKLEITEGAIMGHPQSAAARIAKLREKGIDIHLDDFGTGYSALGCLHHFPVNALKIDRTFLPRAEAEAPWDNRPVLEAVVRMAESLGVEVVVEGIETPAQLSIVNQLSCKYGQGYLFARPAEPAVAEELLRKSRDFRPQMSDS
jgi:diguanylate cyclase (GGDEF)-like protein/PAS domain S-box-containing protein